MTDEKDEGSLEQFEAWKERHAAGTESPKELFRQVSRIAQFLAYDLVDKLQWWEKETLKLSDDEIDERIPHMSAFLEQLRTAYDTFSDVDF